MSKAISSFGALFAATFIFLIGNGLLGTLLSTRMALENVSLVTNGIVLSGYYIGLLAGPFFCHHLIERIGHIRAFTIFAAGTAAVALMHGLYLSVVFWCVLRFLCGITSFGMFMVIESWLNECAEPQYRGRVFSVYLILSYLGIGIGQQLLNAGDIQANTLFIIAGVIFALCMIPVSATESVQPRLPERKKVEFYAIFKTAPVGMLGCMAAGMTNGSFYSLMPVVCSDIGMTPYQLSWIMTVTVFCGLAAQWIVGTLSDRFDRTVVLSIIVSLIAVASGFMFFFKQTSPGLFAVSMGAMGTLIFAVYPLAVARAHDVFEGRQTVAVSACLLLSYGIGASVSPILASGAMSLLKTPFGLFAFWSAINMGFALIGLVLVKKEKVVKVAVEDQVASLPLAHPHGGPVLPMRKRRFHFFAKSFKLPACQLKGSRS